jgi:hypothetical protein
VTRTTAVPFPPPADFSVVLGGPLYQLLRRTRLSDDALALVHRRIVAFLLVTWVPLLLLSLLEGRAWWGSVTVPFLLNAEVQARLLIALPLLIVAELGVHVRMRRLVQQFFKRDLIADHDLPRVKAAIDSALRLRNSIAAELLLFVVIYAAGIPLREYLAVDANTCASGSSVDGRGFINLSLAGWWHALVSVPVFQFMLLRWYFRVFIWARFLLQMSRIELKLVPTHPDRVGGLGFLTNVVYAFTPILLAHGVLLAGLIADRIFFDGARLTQFNVEIFGSVALLVFLVLFPLMVFAGQLARVKRTGLGEYGGLAQHYVREFDAKWLRRAAPAEPLMGSADLQSLADLGNSFAVIQSMRFVPFSKETILQLALVTLAPVAPLLLTMISFEELMKRLLSAVF